MSITSLQFKAEAGHWLRMLVSQNDTIRLFDSLASNSIKPLKCAPNGTVVLRALLCADSLKGDHMAFDSIIIGADDAMHGFDTLPVWLKYNDLPRIFSLSFDFAFNTPYWLVKSKAVKAVAYVFPPHAKISITFSEPVDSASVAANLKIYSIYDLSSDPTGGPCRFHISGAREKPGSIYHRTIHRQARISRSNRRTDFSSRRFAETGCFVRYHRHRARS